MTLSPREHCLECDGALVPPHLAPSDIRISTGADYVCLVCRRSHEWIGTPPKLMPMLPRPKGRQVERIRAPLFVMVVDRQYPDVFGRLSTVFISDATVGVIWDRRSLLDRRAAVRVARDRRGTPSQGWNKEHFTVTLHAGAATSV